MTTDELFKITPTVYRLVNNKAFFKMSGCFTEGTRGYYIDPEPEDWGFDEEDKGMVRMIINKTRSVTARECLLKFHEIIKI